MSKTAFHVHIELDKFGYCTSCDERVMTHFKGFPLPDKPHQEKDCPNCDDGFIVLIDYDGPGLHDEDNCYCECHSWRQSPSFKAYLHHRK